MSSTSTSTNAEHPRTLIYSPIPIRGDAHNPAERGWFPQATQYQVAPGRSFTVDGMTWEEGDEVVMGRDVSRVEMEQLVRDRIVRHEHNAQDRELAKRFDPTGYTHQNVSGNAWNCQRSMILPDAFCEAADFAADGRPAEVIEESRMLVRLYELDIRFAGDHTHVELVRPRREIPAVAPIDGAQALEARVKSGMARPIPEWVRARYEEEAAVRHAREQERARIRDSHKSTGEPAVGTRRGKS